MSGATYPCTNNRCDNSWHLKPECPNATILRGPASSTIPHKFDVGQKSHTNDYHESVSAEALAALDRTGMPMADIDKIREMTESGRGKWSVESWSDYTYSFRDSKTGEEILFLYAEDGDYDLGPHWTRPAHG